MFLPTTTRWARRGSTSSAGEAAGYIVADKAESELVKGNGSTPVADRTDPADGQERDNATTQIPLIIQDKSFVPAAKTLAKGGSPPGTSPTGVARAASGSLMCT